MTLPASIAVWSHPFGGMHAPEAIVILVVLLVLFGGRAVSAGADFLERDHRLTREEVYILLFVGGALAIGIGMLVWQEFTR